MLVIGLTGGIASGKSAASAHFANLGVPVIDADVVARQVVEPGEPGLQAVAEAFGPDVLDNEGRLRRSVLRQRVFADVEARRRLERILHPRIRERLRGALRNAEGPYAVLVVPLLVENGMSDMVDRILVVDVPETVQRERVVSRDGGTPDQADAIMASQASRQKRLSEAHDVIYNTGTLDELKRQVETLHDRYLQMTEQEAACPDRIRDV